jgi:hypothetical protein
VSAKGKPRTTSNSSASTSAITYSSSVDETLVLPPYVVSLLAPPPFPPSAAPNAQASPGPPTLVINDFESLAAVQSISVPPDSDSPISDSNASKHPTARLLTASSSSSQPPLVVLTSPAGSAEQTMWIGTMEQWENQVEELGRQGKWEEAIRLLRRSSALDGRSSLPVSLSDVGKGFLRS